MRWRWFLPLFCWGVLPIVMIIFPWVAPPTAIEQETSVKTIGWLMTLLYVIPGWWLSKQAAHDLDEKSKPFHAVMVVFVFGTLASIGMGALSTNFATVVNARHSEASTPRSLFVSYYTKRFSGRNGSFWITYAILPDREQPNNAATIPRLLDNLTGPQSGYQSGYLTGYHEGDGLLHLCMNEHRGSLGWLWYDQIGPCTQAPEHFHVWALKNKPISEQIFASQANASAAVTTGIPLSTSISMDCENPPQGTNAQLLTCTSIRRPTQADDEAVGIDLLALGQQFPLPSTTKLGARVETWNSQFILVKLDTLLFLYDREQQHWIWLKTEDGSVLESDGRSTWIMSSNGHSLYQRKSGLFEPTEFYRWDTVGP